jgi:hypothetical protein
MGCSQTLLGVEGVVLDELGQGRVFHWKRRLKLLVERLKLLGERVKLRVGRVQLLFMRNSWRLARDFMVLLLSGLVKGRN